MKTHSTPCLAYTLSLLFIGFLCPSLHADTLVRGSLSGDSLGVYPHSLDIRQDTIVEIRGIFSLGSMESGNTRLRDDSWAGEKAILHVKKNGVLQVGSEGDSVFGELRIVKNTALYVDAGAVLHIARGSQVIVEQGGEFRLGAGASVVRSAPQAFVIERGATACVEDPHFVPDDFTIISPGIIDQEPCIDIPPPPPIILPTEETALAPRDSFYVNQLQGMASISESGAVLFEIPLALAAGTAGLQPQLSLLYNSQGGEGVLGRGFSLRGLSAIVRTGKDFYHDNEKTGVALDWGDQFALDGQRLIRTTGTAEVGSDGLTYDTENASFASIKSFGNGAGYLGPQYFAVDAKDGSSALYGTTPNGRSEFTASNPSTKVVAEYFITKQMDPNGNYFTYDYYNEGGALYLKEIQYTGNERDALSPSNKIVFSYESRRNPAAYYIGHHKVYIEKRLKEIKVYAQESLVYTYTIHYTLNTNTINFIRQYDGFGLLLGELNFLWQDTEHRFESSKRLTSSYGNDHNSGGWSNASHLRLLADVDGDGKSDIVGFGENDVAVALARNGFSSTLAYNQGFTKTRGGWNADYSRFVQDVNGDGQADIVGFGEYGVDVALSNGSSFDPATQWTPQCAGKDGWNTPSKYPRHLADFNGDGLVDIIAIGEGGTSVLMNSGSGFSGGTPFYYFFGRDQGFEYNEGDESYVADINGDGRADLVALKHQDSDCFLKNCKKRQYTLIFSLSNGNSFGTVNNSVKTVVMDKKGIHAKFFEDVNGDGKADFVYNYQNAVFVALSRGDGFEEPIRWIDNPNITLSFLADVNHDGLPDVIGCERQGVYVSLNTGKSFLPPLLWNANSVWTDLAVYPLSPSNSESKFITLGDANGDGQADLVGFSGDGVYLSTSLAKAQQLIRIQDNTGALYSFAYDYLSSPACYQKGYKQSYPLQSFQGAFSVCRTFNSRIHQKTLHYQGAILHRKGRGFLGFLHREENDALLGLRQVIQQNIDAKYLQLLPSRQETYATLGNLTLLARNESQWEFRDLGNRRFTLQTNTNTAYDGSTQSSRYTTTSYDANGNVELHKETASDVENITQNTYVASAGRAIPNRLATETTTSRFVQGSRALVTVTQYKYTVYGNLLLKIERAGTPQACSTAYIYYAHGLPRSISTSAAGLTPRTKTLGYDPLFRFVTQKTDFLGTSYETFDALGRRLSATGIDGHTATYTYDRYGMLERVNYPNGQTTFTARRNLWDHPLYAYFLLEQSSGKPYVKTYFNLLGQAIASETVNPSGVLVSKSEYDPQGRLQKEYLPDFAGSSALPQYITYTYDVYGRVIQEALNINVGSSSVVRRTSTQYNGLTTTLTLPSGQIRSQSYHPAGFLLSATDAGGSLTYAYEIPHLPSSVTAPGGATTTFTYDAYGRKTSIIDPNAAKIAYTYNAFDEILTQSDPRGYVTAHTYDSYGRLIKTSQGNNRSLTYTYLTSGRNIGKILSITTNQQTSHRFTYDDYGRLTRFDDYSPEHILSTQYAYNSLGQLIGYRYPSGYQLSYSYDNNGYQTAIHESQGGRLVWQLTRVDPMGNELHSTVVGSRSKTQTYNAFGQATSRSLTGLMSYSYHYDLLSDNMTSRQNSYNAQNESFTYDALDRLTTGLSYHPNGNIASKQGVGTYSYHPTKKHALTQVSQGIEKGLDHQITYSATGKVLSILPTEDAHPRFDFLYGPDDQRRRVDVQLPTHQVVRHYSRDYEQTTIQDAQGGLHSQQTKEYVHSPYGLVAIRNNGQLQAVATDHLGSIVAEYKPQKNAFEFYGYDAWGRRYRKDGPQSLYYFDEHLSEVAKPSAFNDFYSRGYTGHEHLDAFGLINMNGRLYDPIVGRFLSPDPMVQAPTHTQNFNRYSYCINNPLTYTDPKGEFFVLDSWLIGLVSGWFKKDVGGLDEANRRANNDLRLWAGHFVTDPNKGFFGRTWELISRFTWQGIQTSSGFAAAQAVNTCSSQMNWVEHKYGATVAKVGTGSWGGITLGSYIMGSTNIEADADNFLFQHEYGHYIQSQRFGPFYLSKVGLPSLLSSGDHNLHPVEQDANVRAFTYLNKNIEGYEGWKHKEEGANPIINYDWSQPYDSETNQNALKNGKIRLKWYDYLLPLHYSAIINVLKFNNR